MVFDSAPVSLVTVAAAAALFAAAIGAWILSAPLRADARLPLRFAAMLLSAPAAATLFDLAGPVLLFVLPLASCCLMAAALARFARSLNGFAASLALALALAGGLATLLGAPEMFALVPAALAALAIMASALHGTAWMAALAGAACLAAVLGFAAGSGSAGVLLFCGAALLGLARSASAVEQSRDAVRPALIGSPR